MADTIVRPVRAALIGAGIQASLTPAMHMQEGVAQGFSYEYHLIDLVELGLSTESLPGLLDKAEKEGLGGLNITHPCKQLVIPYLDELSQEARALGAVNTIVFRDGKRYGHNTDWWGFAESFRHGLPDADLSTGVQIGAGGAGVATAYAALSLGLRELVVLDQQGERAERLAETLSSIFPDASVTAGSDLASALAQARGLIHATPMGMAAHPGLPLPPSLLRSDLWVAEIVYFPLETELLRQARARGCPVLDGGGMAVYQAVGAFRLLTGRQPDAGRMRRHFISMTS
jgi:shikimate dehydrogenase